VQRRKEAMEAINKITSDIKDQYNKALKDSRKDITVATFLKALMFQDNKDIKKVRGLKMASLYAIGTLVCHHMFYPTNICCAEGTPSATSPHNTYKEDKTKKEIGNSFYGAFTHKLSRLKK